MASTDPLALPSPEVLREIEAKQDAKAAELRKLRTQPSQHNERETAAKLIQKNYRGYRTRRSIQGYGIDSSARWTELLKEAKYYNTTSPASREMHAVLSPTSELQTKARWERVRSIATHAGSDNTSEEDIQAESPEEVAKLKEQKRKQKAERDKNAKMMGLDYFLEMVDHKHRYGSNLRRYHVEWKKADTQENFFYWLDYGEGKDLDLEDRPRSRLDSEFVRYLSRDERQKYLVKIDKDGLFRYAKNNNLVTTSPDYRDSIDGIVPVDDKTPTWRQVTTGSAAEPEPHSSDADSLSGLSTGSTEDLSKYANTELHDAKGIDKVRHLNVDTVMNHMLRKTTKKNTWIFVADTSFRMYIGIKQSGAFQHSSFLRGARVSAAGLSKSTLSGMTLLEATTKLFMTSRIQANHEILHLSVKVKRGQLRKLSPLSGHYAPPMSNFRHFLKSLKSAEADLSHLNTSRSYAVILGLEGYVGAKKRVKSAGQSVQDVFDQQGKREREEAAKDKSQSAQREREILHQEAQSKRQNSFPHRVKTRLGFKEGDAKPAAQ